MPLTADERRELEERVVAADLNLKTKQAFWESPKGFAAVIAALAVTIGAVAGIVGFNLGRSSPPTQIIFQPGSIVVPPAPTK